jgi:S1-C subfamily serine protease
LAIASLITALAGVPLFGVLTGLVAVVLGAMALGGIRGGNQRGLAWAAAGLLLGLVDVVGWVVFLAMFFTGGIPLVHMQDMQPDLSSFKDLDPKIGRAMRSNVLIEGRAGMGVHLGSGVILRIKDGWADVLTNRHVADPDFAADPEGVRAGGAGGHLTVQLVGQDAREGTVTWIAPDGVDLAILRVACSTDEARSAAWKQKTSLRVGDPVFAIGNPHGLGWTHTQGTISQFRTKESGVHRLRVIQMQTAVNPGNSGGGLYDQKGDLVGIVTWSQDKRVSEGLNFAIAMESVLPLLPGDLAVPPEEKD